MVKAGGVYVCILILALDIGAGILGLQAEVQENKVKHLTMWIFKCKEPSQGAFKLGLSAGGLLCLAHVLANLLGGSNNCICSQEEKPKVNRAVNACDRDAVERKARASCSFSHHHLMSMGGIACFVHGLFSIVYYVSVTAV